jgi:hypothetical protein
MPYKVPCGAAERRSAHRLAPTFVPAKVAATRQDAQPPAADTVAAEVDEKWPA